jgi:hypothetical protein
MLLNVALFAHGGACAWDRSIAKISGRVVHRGGHTWRSPANDYSRFLGSFFEDPSKKYNAVTFGRIWLFSLGDLIGFKLLRVHICLHYLRSVD